MKNKIHKLTILFFLLFFAFPVLSADTIKIEFEQTPLFSNANLSPGQTVQRWVKVENISDETQKIAIKAINFCNCKPEKLCLNNVLFLEIKNLENKLYYDSLTNFFNLNEIFLSELNSKTAIQYDISIYFDEQASDEYQGLTTCFDLTIGATENEQPVSNSSQGSSSSYYKPNQPNINELQDNPKTPDVQNTPEPKPKAEPVQFPAIPSSQKIAKKINSIIAGIQTTTAEESVAQESDDIEDAPAKKTIAIGTNIFLLILFFIIFIFLIQIFVFKNFV